MKNIILPFLLFCSYFSSGQNATIDSLKQVLETNIDNKERVNTLHELFSIERFSDLNQAEVHLRELEKLAIKTGNHIGLLNSKHDDAVLQFHKSNLEEALVKVAESKKLLEQYKEELEDSFYYRRKARTLEVEAVVKNTLGRKEAAVEVFYELIDVLEKSFEKGSSDYFEYMGAVYTNLAVTYTELNDSLALKYVRKARDFAVLANDEMYIAYNLVSEFVIGRNLDLEYDYLNNLLDSVIYNDKISDNKFILQEAFCNKCVLLVDHGFIQEAKDFCKKANALDEFTQNDDTKCRVLEAFAYIAEEEKSFQESNNYYKQAYQLAESIGISYNKLDIISSYAMSFDSIGDYNMASHYKGIYIDSLLVFNDKELSKQFLEAEAKFQTAEKEKQIAQQSLQIAQQENERSRILLVGILALLAATAIYFWYYTRQNKKKRQAELALQKQTIESEKLRELDQVKSNFFANISHEFRTPLTLILGPLDDMLKGTFKGNQNTYHRMMQRNGNRLLQLINQLLDLSRLESGKMILKASENDIAQLTKSIAYSFESLAASKEIDFKVDVPNKNITTYFDVDKYEKILTNLLSNAFKFTPEGGGVSLLLKEKNNQVEVKITDSGIGIEKKDLPHIFDRFYQVDSSATREQSGSGIGLALTKELVNLHGGNIEAQSELGKATVFTFSLPLGKAHLKADQITKEVVQPQIVKKPVEKEMTTTSLSLIKSKQPIVLVVEDNADVRLFIKDKLKETYQILEAENGKIGLAVANDQIPDLIISDVMMPEMDGYEFCKHIKTDERTSHIPVIMLTAKADLSDKIEGLETGADDFLTKPFNGEELLVRMHNLIEQRKKLREKFSSGEIKLKEVAVTSMDEEFLTKLLQSIETNLADERYGTEELASDMHLGRRQLLRKTKALTNQTPSKLIRSLRLQRAKELLKKGAGNVSEVSMQVGFNGLSYFIKCFKEEFGILPSEL